MSRRSNKWSLSQEDVFNSQKIARGDKQLQSQEVIKKKAIKSTRSD